MPIAFLPKAYIHPEVRKQPGRCRGTEHRQQSLLWSSLPPSRTSPLPSPPAPEGRGTPLHPALGKQKRPSESEQSRLPIGLINSPHHGRLFSWGRVHTAHGQGREEADKESQGNRVRLRGEVWGDGSNLALEQHAHKPVHSAPPGH